MDNNQPLVSILMNCYNGEKYLKEAIDSIYNQTYENWKIIFIDNCSTDNSAKIAKSYDDGKLMYYRTEKNIPLNAARNFGLQYMDGDYLGFLDTDDMWVPNKLEKQITALNDSGFSFCYSNYYNLIEDKLNIAHSTSQPSGDIFKYQISNYTIGLLTVVFSKKCLNSIDEKFNEKYIYPGDFDFFIRILKENSAVYIHECLGTYRHDNPYSISNTKTLNNITELKNLIFDYRERYSRNDIQLAIDALEIKTILKESDYYMKKNMFSQARSVLKPFIDRSRKLKIYYFLSFFGFNTIRLLRYINIKMHNIKKKI